MDYLTASTPTYTAAEIASGLSDDSRDAFASAMIQALKVDRKSVRERAINFFKSDLENLLPYILKEVDNPSMHIRRAISLLVRGQGEKARSVIPSLIQNLGAKDQSLVWDSRDTLEKLGIDPSEELLFALDAENVPVKSKERIAGILAEKRYSVAESKLWELAKDNTPLGHAAAACYLYLSSRPISNEMLPLYINALQYQRLESVGYTGAEHALREVPKLQTPEMVDALLSLLKSEDREVRIKVAGVLGSFPGFKGKIVSALEWLLQETDLKIGEAAALSIGKLQPGNEKAISSLIKLAQLPGWPRDVVDPLTSIVALGEMRAKQAIPVLGSLLSGLGNPYDNYIAACALSKISPESSEIYIPYMIPVLDPQAVGRGFDVEVLKCLSGAGKYGKAALPELKNRLSSTSDEKSLISYSDSIQAIENGEN
jgi:HEAT repeat protein